MTIALVHSPADVVRQHLIDAGLGTAPSASGSWPVFAIGEPSEPDNCLTVYDTAGSSAGRTMPDGEIQGMYGIQVRIRSATHALGWAKANAIGAHLSEVAYQEVVHYGASNYLIHCFSRIGDVIPLGKNVPDTRRFLFTLNCMVNLRQL